MNNLASNKKILFWFVPALFILIIWNLYTLQYSPVPWIDEVYFASLTKSLVDGNGLILSIGLDNPVYHYGPVYFVLTALFVKIGGFNLFVFRLVELLFSFLTVFLVFKIMRQRRIRVTVMLTMIILLVTDSLFVYCSHIGRMELVSSFFVLFSFFIYDKYKADQKLLYIIYISAFLLLSFLTTSRSAVIVIPIGLSVIVHIIKSHKWWHFLAFVGIPIVGFIFWMFLSFGSLHQMIDYYLDSQTSNEGNFIARFVGGSFIISKTHYPLVLLTILIVIHSIIKRYFNEISLYFFSILLFYLIVKSSSDTYSVMILPFYYLIIGEGLNEIFINYKKKDILQITSLTICGICFIINIGLFFTKWTLIESSKEARDERKAYEWISRSIPKGSVVVGSDVYYYTCIENECTFKSLEQIFTTETETLDYILNTIHADYLLFNSEETIPEALTMCNLIPKEEVGNYSPECTNDFLANLLSKIGVTNHSTFKGNLYKIIIKK